MKQILNNFSLILMVFISVVPLKSYSQKTIQKWTTPIQNVEFKDSVIVVINSRDALQVFDNLKPVHYDISLVKIYNVEGIGSRNWEGCRNYAKQLTEYIEEWDINLANNHDKEKFLESCVLLILLNLPSNNSVPEKIPLILKYLGHDVVKSVAHNAVLTKELYDSYFKKD